MGKPSWGSNPNCINDHYVDGLKIKDLNYLEMKDKALEEANNIYDKFEKIVNGREIPVFNDILSKYEDIQDARIEFCNHPVIEDLWKDDQLCLWSFGREINMSRKEYLQDVFNSVVTPYAFIDLNGGWHEKGKMGFFGSSFNERDSGDWCAEFWSYLKTVPDTTYMIIVDCHI